MQGKFVTEKFKEAHKVNPEYQGKNVFMQKLIDSVATEARWDKAVQRLRERDEFTNSPKDIGPLLKEVSTDILDEEKEELKNQLLKHFWKEISRGATRGLPEWYKEKLAKDNFDNVTPPEEKPSGGTQATMVGEV